MTTYVPDPRQYQQIPLGGVTGNVDCTAWGAAFRVDAHTNGNVKTTGRLVRLHSDEPIPDKASPGLNLGQVDAAVIDITSGRVDFDTRVQSRSLSRPEVKARIQDGRFCGMSIWRGVLVDRGFVTGFRGGHDGTFFTRDTEPDQLLMFDSLVTSITRLSWDVAFDAAERMAGGLIYAQFTRDLSPDFVVTIAPLAGQHTRAFYTYELGVNGRIVGSHLRHTGGIRNKRCSRPTFHTSATKGITGRYLVQITEGEWSGSWVNAKFAEETNP